MADISAKVWNKAEVSVIRLHENDDVNKTLLNLLCISDAKKRWDGKNLHDLIDKGIKGKYGVKNINDLTKQKIRKYKIDRARLIKGSKHSMYVSEDILVTIIMQSKLSSLKTIEFRADLGFNQINLILKKEQSVVIPPLKAFFAEKNKATAQSLKNRRLRTDMYFSEHKFAVEIDEKRHTDRNQDKEKERQTKIEKHSECKCFHRINSGAKGFDISFFEISKMQGYIAQSNKEKLKKEKEAKIKELKEKLEKLEAQIKEPRNKIKN